MHSSVFYPIATISSHLGLLSLPLHNLASIALIRVCMAGSVGDIIAYSDSPGEDISLALGHVAFSPYPYSVTGIAIWYIGD